MKFFAYIISFYIIALTVLPTVRAIKKTYAEKCQTSWSKNNDNQPDGCEKGKIVMSLNFSPIQFVGEFRFLLKPSFNEFETIKIKNSNYKKIFIDQFQHKIWQPPKIIFSI